MSDEENYLSTPTKSEPVSDVDPEEMARLMADIDEIDNDLFKSKGSDAKKSSPSIKESKKVTFPKDLETENNEAENEWDADDILNSEEEKVNKKVVKSVADKPLTPSPSINATKKAASEIFNDSPTVKSNKSPKGKDKLMSDLFADDKESLQKGDSKLTPSKKSKTDIMFDDDDDNLLDIRSRSTPKRNAKTTDSGFLDDLLGKSVGLKPANKPSSEFVLPDHYKMKDKERGKKADELELSGYNPSSLQSMKKNGKSNSSDSLDDLFSNTDSRPRRRISTAKQNKPFEIDDDDILGPRKAKQDKANEQNSLKKAGMSDQWLFGSPKGTPQNMKEEINKNQITASVEYEAEKPSQPQSKKDEWLDQLLAANKTDSGKQTTEGHLQAKTTTPVQGTSVGQYQYQSSPLVNSSLLPNPDVPITNSQSVDYTSILQNQMAQGQARLQAEVASITSQLTAQKQQAESQLVEQFQLQMQDQQQRMSQLLLAQQSQTSLSSFPMIKHQSLVEDDESIKQLKIDLHKAETEAGRLGAELELLRKQHSQEILIMEETNKKKANLEEVVWKRMEERINEERLILIENQNAKIKDLQSEKEALIASYEINTSSMKAEWSEILERTREMYTNAIERMKKEHQNAIDRLTELKNIELKAVLSANGRMKEVESVLGLLENNTADLSQLTNSVNERHESALELTKRSLQLKEKQLQDMEATLGIARAESERERNRLTVLVSRLESCLANQGSEIESEKWKIAQEKQKLEVEKKYFTEEKRHFQLAIENAQREVAESKEAILADQRELMKSVVKQKSDIAGLHSFAPSRYVPLNSAEINVSRLREEKRILEDNITSLRNRREELIEAEISLEERKTRLNEEQSKAKIAREILEHEKQHLEHRFSDLENREQKLEELRLDYQRKLSNITQSTQNLHLQQDKMAKECAKLEVKQEETRQLISQGICPSCSRRLSRELTEAGYRIQFRAPGDGREVLRTRNVKEKGGSSKSWDPASVLSRLKAAKIEETLVREEKNHQITALNKS